MRVGFPKFLNNTFPMVTNELLESKVFVEDWSELVADAFKLTWTCLRYIQPRIVLSCQCCSEAVNEKWGPLGDLRAEELSSSEAGARQELVKTVDVDGRSRSSDKFKQAATLVGTQRLTIMIVVVSSMDWIWTTRKLNEGQLA